MILPAKTRRELLGTVMGASLGALLGFAISGFGHQFSSFHTIVIATTSGIIGGRCVRGEWGWTATGALAGAVIADILWSNPKVMNAPLGILPGACIGFVIGWIRDFVSSK